RPHGGRDRHHPGPFGLAAGPRHGPDRDAQGRHLGPARPRLTEGDGMVEPVLDPVFRHGIASGDPAQDRVVIWICISHSGDASVSVRWWFEDAEDPSRRGGGGIVEAIAERDWIVSIDVDGLQPGWRYRYGFEAFGEATIVGRTRTFPSDDVE